LKEALEVRRRTLGDTHPQTLISIGSLGALLSQQGKLSEAEPLLREAVSGARTTLGDAHRATIIYQENLDFVLQKMGKA